MNAAFSALEFHPLIDPWLLGAAALAAAGLIGWAILRRARGAWARALAACAALIALADPRITEENRRPLPDLVLAVIDDSPSQHLGGRALRSEQALSELTRRLNELGGIELRTRRETGGPDGTFLFGALADMRAEAGGRKPAAEILITDGRIHDAPPAAIRPDSPPLHVLLSTAPNERDRSLEIVQAPGFALTGKTARVAVRLHDPGHFEPAPVSVWIDGTETARRSLRPGGEFAIDVPVARAGEIAVEFSTPAPEDDLVPANNRAAALVSGVRDRLKVLLVSGEPHAGERAWRNLLKSDPAVDLVHFTILRPPEKDDRTPIRELALITFPVRELFEEKLNDFDLVVFDRYRGRGVLAPPYFHNLAEYVRGGGALLTSMGPEAFDPNDSASPLSQIMGAEALGPAIAGPFVPQRSEAGVRHPVSHGFDQSRWGPWMRRIPARTRSGTVLLQTQSGDPLLVLDRVGKGRSAQLLSDSMWLWARGYQGGGPHDELLRRLAHWLMREPQLEEEALTAAAENDAVRIEARSLGALPKTASVAAPNGETFEIPLIDQGDGRAFGIVENAAPGLWRASAGGRVAVAAIGRTASPELSDPVAGPSAALTAAQSNGGNIFFIQDGIPQVKRVRNAHVAQSSSVLGLERRDEYAVEGRRTLPVPPGWTVSLIFALAAIFAWKREAE